MLLSLLSLPGDEVGCLQGRYPPTTTHTHKLPPGPCAVPQMPDHQAAQQREGLSLTAPELHQQYRGNIMQPLIVMDLLAY